MSFPRWYAGQIITADRLNARNLRMITQENDQAITEQTTYQDSEIRITPEPNAVYAYWLYISYSAAENADFQWTWPVGNDIGVQLASFTRAYIEDATGSFNDGQSIIQRRPGNNTDRHAGGLGEDIFLSAYDSGTFETTSSPGELVMRFAQITSSTETTTLRGGNQTRMLYMRIA